MISFFDVFRPEIRDSYIHDCINPVPNDQCYGTSYYDSYFGLLENNIYKDTSEGPVVSGGSGSVIAYNYGWDTHREDGDPDNGGSPGWFMGGLWSHKQHELFMLWEGNYFEGMMLDNIHGSSSHQMVFRNRLLGRPQDGNCMNSINNEPCDFGYAIALGRYNRWIKVVGNVLGVDGYSTKYDEATFGQGDFNIYSTGYDNASGSQDTQVPATLLRHYNYDYVTDSATLCTSDNGANYCQGGDTDTSIPNSLYLTAQPSWWGTQPWPPIGPDVSGYYNDIPAKDRYEGQETFYDHFKTIFYRLLNIRRRR